jgi:predicted secreted protein
MERDDSGAADGLFDWDAAFEAIVAPLRVPRHVQVARAVGSTVLVAALIVVTWLVLAQVVMVQARGLAHPMR